MSEDMKEVKEFLECTVDSEDEIVESIAEYCLLSENALREILDGIRASLPKGTDAVRKQPVSEVGPTDVNAFKQIDAETEITDDGPYGECRISLDGIAKYSLDMTELLRVEDAVSFRIPNSVVKIRSLAFKDCTSLTEVYMPDSVKKIGKEAFRDCTSLRKIRIPDPITEIRSGTFQNCESLDEVHFSDSVTTIGEYAFSDCGSLEELYIPDSVITIGDYAFDCCQSLKTVHIPCSVVYIGEDAFRGCFYASFTVDPKNKNYYSKAGELIDRNA